MSIGERLLEERKRLGVSQEELGFVGGVKKNAQFQYESGERVPKADYLELIAKSGVDVAYVITGQRFENVASNNIELLILTRMRKMDKKALWALHRAAEALSGDAPVPDSW